MSSARITAALKYVAGLSTVLLFVVVLTLIFSFLGTLMCATLSGMMMGATKASKKLSIPFSAFFPCVLVGVLTVQKSEIAGTKLISLAILCLAAFWVVYFTGAVLMAYEKKNGKDPALPVASGLAPQLEPGDGVVAGAAPVPVLPKLRLEELEGHWSCEVCGSDGRTRKRLLEIRNGALVLSTIDAEGRVCSCARGCVELVALPGNCTLRVSVGADAIPSPSI
jgi:hypothetical protein